MASCIPMLVLIPLFLFPLVFLHSVIKKSPFCPSHAFLQAWHFAGGTKCQKSHGHHQLPGLVTRHPEHGVGAQPGAVTQTGPEPGTLAPCRKISPSLLAAPCSPCCDSQLDGLSVFTESPGAPATPCPPQACAVCPTLPTNSISFVIKNSCNLIRWRSQLQNEGSH